MASTAKRTLQAATALTASVTSDKQSLEPGSSKFLGWLDISACDAGTTVTAKIQHSPDGVNWVDLVAFAVPAAGVLAKEAKAPTADIVFPNIRSSVVIAGGLVTATAKVELYFDPK